MLCVLFGVASSPGCGSESGGNLFQAENGFAVLPGVGICQSAPIGLHEFEYVACRGPGLRAVSPSWLAVIDICACGAKLCKGCDEHERVDGCGEGNVAPGALGAAYLGFVDFDDALLVAEIVFNAAASEVGTYGVGQTNIDGIAQQVDRILEVGFGLGTWAKLAGFNDDQCQWL